MSNQITLASPARTTPRSELLEPGHLATAQALSSEWVHDEQHFYRQKQSHIELVHAFEEFVCNALHGSDGKVKI